MNTEMKTMAAVLVAALVTCSPALLAQTKPMATEKAASESDVAGEKEFNQDEPAAKFDPAYWANSAATILDDQMGKELDKRIPAALLSKAKCAAIFPQLVQAGLGIGAKTGSGLVLCRQASGQWGAPLFIDVTGLTFGVQVGVKSTEAILLAMTDGGLDQLFAGKPVAEGELGVTAGPVGRGAQVGMDVLLKTPLISYTRSKGLYAGATIGGSVMTSKKETNVELYGDYAKPRDILFSDRQAPAEIDALPKKLDQFAPKG